MDDTLLQEFRYYDLLNFCQFLSYFGGEAKLTVNGRSISRDQADVLVNAYLRLNVPKPIGAQLNTTTVETEKELT